MESRAWFALSIDEVARLVKADLARGLASEEAQRRQALEGPNKLPEQAPDTWVRRVVRQLTSPIALMLVFATPAAALVGTPADALVIAAALLINVVIGVFQEGRAEHTFEALRKSEAKRATVFRDGALENLPAEQMVRGDIVHLTAGSSVPADMRLIEVHGLATNESALSGEWVPVEKNTQAVNSEAPLSERSCMAYAGTLVSAGSGTGIVVGIGAATEFGGIAAVLSEVEEPETPLERDVRKIASWLIVVALGIITAVFMLALFNRMDLREAVLIAVAIAVASVPEGLPAAVTVALALSMERILKKGGLVKGLLSAETLGATSVILTDKTGTLTEGRMRVSGFATLSGTTEDISGDKAKQLLRAAVLASDGFLERMPVQDSEAEDAVRAHGRPLEQAILLAGFGAGISDSELRKEFQRIDELPFAAERRFGGTLINEAGHAVAYLSGAPELFITHARQAATVTGMHPFTAYDRTFFTEALRRSAQSRERVIAVARVYMHGRRFPQEDALEHILGQAEMLGFIIFSDPIRAEAKDAVAAMQSAGARVVMATGDNPDTALSIARAVGIAGPRAHARTGNDLENLSDDELYTEVMKQPVFARVAPKDKLRIAQTLTARGEVVAMTGDGVNDAPALRAAAIGVALGGGTEVAKESADLVLLNDSFSVITAAIVEGRRLRDNVKKIFAFLIATNFSETFIIVAALAASLPLPLLPVQILWANLISGGFMNVAFAFEPLYPSAMRRSPKDPETAHILSPSTRRLVLLVGLTTGVLLISIFLFLGYIGLPEAELRTIMFVAVSLDAVFTALSLKSFGTPIWRIPLASNWFLLGALVSSIVLLLLSLFVPVLARIVHVVPLRGFDLLILVFLGIVDLAIVEGAKYFLFIRPESRAAQV